MYDTRFLQSHFLFIRILFILSFHPTKKYLVLARLSFSPIFYHLGKALELARTDVFAKIQCKQGAKLMLVITDGYSSDDVTLPGIELRDMGVVMLGIGYGPESQLMRYTLESLSSDPKDQFTFIFCYDRLVESTQQIVKRACEGTCIFKEEPSLKTVYC